MIDFRFISHADRELYTKCNVYNVQCNSRYKYYRNRLNHRTNKSIDIQPRRRKSFLHFFSVGFGRIAGNAYISYKVNIVALFKHGLTYGYES